MSSAMKTAIASARIEIGDMVQIKDGVATPLKLDDVAAQVMTDLVPPKAGYVVKEAHPSCGQVQCQAWALGERIAELTEVLHDARLQIEYLHEKFTVTGTGNTVLARINAVLAK